MSVCPSIMEEKINNWKKELMDVTRRNRLLFFKETKSSTVHILHPDLQEIYDALVQKNQELVALSKEGFTEFELKDRSSLDLKKNQFLADLNDKDLKKVLYNIRLKSQTALQELGVNILYITFGMLQWKEVEYAEENVYSPIILIPIELIQDRKNNLFKIKLHEEEVVLNPTLIQKLDNDFKLTLPSISDDLDTFDIKEFLNRVQATVNSRGWKVKNDSYIGPFSFNKLVMYNDLVANSRFVKDHPILMAMGGDKSKLHQLSSSDLITADQLDNKVNPTDVYQVLDADSSQQEAILAAKKDVSFVLQGPPGTGKSQTITNIIAECLADGKTVLFVSEKMAALEVVKKRLDGSDLGDYCLELHSHKTNKRVVIDELNSCYEANFQERISSNAEHDLRQLSETRTRLNDYVRVLHTPYGGLHITPYKAHGKLVALGDIPNVRFKLKDVLNITPEEYSNIESSIKRLATLSKVIENYENHPWYGSIVPEYTFQSSGEIQDHLEKFIDLCTGVLESASKLARFVQLREPENLQDITEICKLLTAYAPDFLKLNLVEMIEKLETIYKKFYRYVQPGYWKELKKVKTHSKHGKKITYEKALEDLKYAKRVIDKIGVSSNPIEEDFSVDDQLAKLISLLNSIHNEVEFLGTVFPLSELQIEGQSIDSIHLSILRKWLQYRFGHLSELREWVEFQKVKQQCNAIGLTDFVNEILDKKMKAEQLVDIFHKGYYQIWLDSVYQREPVLSQFSSKHHATLIQDFKELDQRQIKLARERVRQKLNARRPRTGFGQTATSEPGILKREAMKQRRLKPIRQLFGEIPNLLLALKPCLLMSPLSVAQFLDPEKYVFDVVIFDEASQISPEDAVGVIMRGKQLIVVGDSKQMPPTRFFASIQSDEVDEDTPDELHSLESILDECKTLGLAEKKLSWHYRSKHESLIAFSNYQFYRDLYTFPGANHQDPGLGIELVYVPDGIYDRGKSTTNLIEARKIADLVLNHFENYSNRSLGVIAFSQAQQMAILDVIEELRLQHPEYESFFDEKQDEHFFVKNLENVQGDERDVIFFSVGYGKDIAGKLTYNFGPLTKQGGPRRLNVAATRARYQIKLVSSILPTDLDASTTNEGVKILRAYLEFAQRKGDLKSLASQVDVSPDAEFDSPFEEEVYNALTESGLILEKQVGCSGYRIDLAVKDPESTGRFLLGIECDGAMYHSAKTARDRDRLRQNVLESLDWRIHRIWSRDWIDNPKNEIDKVLIAVKQSKNIISSINEQPRKAIGVVVEKTEEPDRVRKTETIKEEIAKNDNIMSGISQYEKIRLSDVRPLLQKKDIDFAGIVFELSLNVIEKEGPINKTLLFRRLAELLGIERLTSNKVQEFNRILQKAINKGKCYEKNDFVWSREMKQVPIRTVKQGDEPREITEIAPEEIAECIKLYMQHAFGIAQKDLISEVLKIFGHIRSGAKKRIYIETVLNSLVESGQLEAVGEQIKLK